MLLARFVLPTTALVVAIALSISRSAPVASGATMQPTVLLESPRRDRPRISGRLLDERGEPFVGDITLGSRIVFSDSAAMAFGVTASTDASGTFDFELRSPPAHSPGSELTWTLTPRESALYGDFALAARAARRAVGTLVFVGGEDGAITADLGTVQLAEPPRVASLRIEGPVATTHAVVVDEKDYANSKYGPFSYPFGVFDVATGSTVELFSWSTADRWHVFTQPDSPRAEDLMAVIERGQDLVLVPRECFQVCISIDAPPTAEGAHRALFVVMPLLSAKTGTRLGMHEEVAIHWISLGLHRRRGPQVYQLAHTKRDFDLYLPAGLHRFEYWEYEHVLEGPRLAASAPVFVDRFVDMRAWR